MTVPQQTVATPAAELVEAVVTAAGAAAAALPLAADVVPGAPGTAEVPAGDCVAVSARLTGEVSGTLVLVAGPEVVAALQDGPLGPLDPAAALQPAIDGAAASLGARADGAVLVDLATAFAQVGSRAVPVPLLAGDVHHATLVADLVTPPRGGGESHARQAGIDLLRDVEMEVTVEIGRTRMTVRELLALTPGTVVELDRAAGSPADLLVNGTLLARGEIVVVDEDFGIRITEIVSSGLGVDGATR